MSNKWPLLSASPIYHPKSKSTDRTEQIFNKEKNQNSAKAGILRSLGKTERIEMEVQM